MIRRMSGHGGALASAGSTAALSVFGMLVAVMALPGCSACSSATAPPGDEPLASATTIPVSDPSGRPLTSSSAMAKPGAAPGTPLRLLTYNVLASPVLVEMRTKAVIDELRQSDADVIALQEVADWMADELAKAEGIGRGAGHYAMPMKGGRPFAPGGQLVLSRYPIRQAAVEVLPGRQRRTLMVVEIDVAGEAWTIATSHLESFLTDGPTRAKQLDRAFDVLETATNAVLLGDLNFGDGEQPETAHLPVDYVDPWSNLRPDQPGYTWNMKDNPLAFIGAFVDEPNRRLDRILVRSPHWKPVDVSLVGNKPVGRAMLDEQAIRFISMPERRTEHTPGPIDVFPSDHYGIVTTLKKQ